MCCAKARAFLSLTTVLILSVFCQAGTITNRLNIQDSGIRVGYSELNSGLWAYLNEATAGTYCALSQFDLTGISATVTSATLDLLLRDIGGGEFHTITVYPLVQADEDWVETQATGLQKATGVPWSGGSRPYDSSISSSDVWDPSASGVREAFIFDVTAVLQRMIDNGQATGTFYITSDAPGGGLEIKMAQKEVQWDRPSGAPFNGFDYQALSVESTGTPAYGLTIINGTPAYTVNFESTPVAIQADPALEYEMFDQWLGDTAGSVDVSAPNTTIVTQASLAAIMATYTAVTYELTVTSGSGSGTYDVLSVVAISADPAPTGMLFAQWTGDIAGIADEYSPDTTITITADASITATYRYGALAGDLNDDGVVDIIDLNLVLIDWGRTDGAITDPNSDADGDGTVDVVDLNTVLIDWGKSGSYFLTVVDGAGDGFYLAGQVAVITADALLQGKLFEQWVGDTLTVADTNDPITTLVMPAWDTTVTATHTDPPGEAIYDRILYPYQPYDGPYDGTGDQYVSESEITPETKRIQDLDAIYERWGQKPYSQLWDGDSWASERAIFIDITTGAMVYRLTNDYGSDATAYHHGSWSANGAHIVWTRKTPFGSSTTTTGLTAMNSDGTNIRPIARAYSNVVNHQCSATDPNIVYASEGGGVRVRSFNILTGNAVDLIANVYGTWHLKHSPDGEWLMGAKARGSYHEMYVVSVDGSTKHTWNTAGRIHDDYVFHPDANVNYISYTIENLNPGFRMSKYDGTGTIVGNTSPETNHGSFGMAPLPGTSTPRASAIHVGASKWTDGGAGGLNWQSPITINDPAKGSNPYWFMTPNTNYGSYASWKPDDEPWACGTLTQNDLSYVSELNKLYTFPVTNEAAPRFRIALIGNRSKWCLDAIDGSPDGTKFLLNSNMLMSRQMYYVVAMLPEEPTSPSAIYSGGNVLVSWTPAKHSKETKGYYVYRSTTSGSGYMQLNIAPATGTNYTDTTADTNSTYFYVVSAVEHSGLESGYSDEAAYGTGAATAERTVFVEAENYDWDDDGNPAFWPGFYGTASDLYYIWQRQDGSNATCSINVTIPKSDDYYIWVRMQNGACVVDGQSLSTSNTRWGWSRSAGTVYYPSGSTTLDVNSTVYGTGIDAIYLATDSSFSPSGRNAMDQTAPDQLTGLSATADGAFKANLSWAATSAGNLHHYNVYASTSGSSFNCENATLVASPDTSSYLDWQLKPSTIYYYKVTAVDRQGNESTPSSSSSVTTGSIATRTIDQALFSGSATVNVTTADTYVLWVKFNKNNTPSHFMDVTVDGSTKRWLLKTDAILRAGTHMWASYGEQAVFNLSSGNHTFSFVFPYVSGTVTDIKLTNDFSWKPLTYFEAGYGHGPW